MLLCIWCFVDRGSWIVGLALLDRGIIRELIRQRVSVQSEVRISSQLSTLDDERSATHTSRLFSPATVTCLASFFKLHPAAIPPAAPRHNGILCC